VGLTVSLLAFLYASFLVLRTLVAGVDLPGYASLMVVILFLGGTQLIALGLIGEYLGRLYEESKQRPLYLVDVWQPGTGGVSSVQPPDAEGEVDAHATPVVGKQDA